MFRKVFSLLVITIIVMYGITLKTMAFDSNSFFAKKNTPQFSYTGELSPELRLFNNGKKGSLFNLNLRLRYETQNYDLGTLIDYKTGTRKEFTLPELFFKYYLNDYELLLGKKRLVWGKGDKVHIIDQINAEDMSDFINPDYLDRQIGEEMVKVNRYFRNGQSLLEFVYTPEFSPHRVAANPDSQRGNWVMNPLGAISLVKLSKLTGLSQTDIIKKMEAAFPEYKDQFALRYTDSRQGIDYGISYYHGYLREPSYDKAVLLAAMQNSSQINAAYFGQLLTTAKPHYDQVDMLGAEMATVWNTINTRFELAYLRTDDISGTDPLIRNNKIAWIIGGDRDLPIGNLNLNVQLTGEKILASAAIDNIGITDLQYNPEGDYLSNRLIVNLEDSYLNEDLIPKVSLVYNLDSKDYMLEGKVNYKLESDIQLELSHKVFSGDAGTTFGQFKDNDFTTIGISYNY